MSDGKEKSPDEKVDLFGVYQYLLSCRTG